MKEATAERVLKVIKLTAQGLSSSDIAKRLSVNTRSVSKLSKMAGLHDYHPTLRRQAAQNLLKTTTVQTLLGNPDIDPRQKPRGKGACRYYVAKDRAECGVKIKNGQYCDAHKAKVSPNYYGIKSPLEYT